MIRLRLVLLVLLSLALGGRVTLAQAMPPALLIYNAWVRPTVLAPADGATPEAPVPGTVTSAYMTIENIGSADAQLVGVASPLAELGMVHQTTIDSKGIARMQMVSALDIPPGARVSLAPEGYHAMLMNVTHDVYSGQATALTLTFQDSSGATQDVTVGALVSDDSPPADDSLIVANAVAQTDPLDAQALDIFLVIDNRSDQDDRLIGASSALGTTAMLRYISGPRLFPYTALDIAAHAQTIFAQGGVFIRLGDLAQPTGNAFPLTLTFQSGKTATVGVAVLGADHDS